MNITLIQSLWSVVVLITFIGIVLWAFSKKQRGRFDAAAQIPFEEDKHVPAVDSDQEKK